MSGLKIAARFGLEPNRLGFCGPQELPNNKILVDFLSGKKVPEQKIREVLSGFQGAFFYYKLIAKSNNIKDPFDEKVVKAYWLGSNLLEKVALSDLKKMVAEEFSQKGLLSKKTTQAKAKTVPAGALPFHLFHVLYIGSITGRVELKGELLDLCRVSWGKVIAKQKRDNFLRPACLGYAEGIAGRSQKIVPECQQEEKEDKNNKSGLIVECQPLQRQDKRYFLGKPRRRLVYWSKHFLPAIKTGDKVAVHWGHAIQTLNKQELINLKKYTQAIIDSLNNQTN